MPELLSPRFTFVSQAFDDAQALHVVSFEGAERLGAPYRYTLTLLATRLDLPIEKALQSQATLAFVCEPGAVTQVHGIITRLEELHAIGNFVSYEVELAPRLWWATQTRNNQVFLDKTMPEFTAAALTQADLTAGQDFEFRLAQAYEPWEYVCQYNESHYDFVARWFERDGLYTFFEQNEHEEKLVIADAAATHAPLPHGARLAYAPISGLRAQESEPCVHAFALRQIPMPRRLLTRDYNYRRPDLPVFGETEVADSGAGELLLYGDHLRTPAEAKRLAHVRAEELNCREKLYQGQSNVPWLRPGYIFTLLGHEEEAYNQDYLCVEVRHSGNQTRYLTAGLGAPLDTEPQLFYHNEFTAIPAARQFRSRRTTPKPRIHGVLHAHIDAAGSGQYAEIDEQGRYKVILPFDLAGNQGGSASSSIRMAQPYVGDGHGMHFPLSKSTEVLLSFIDGDPDRPVILAAAPNPETPSPVDQSSATQCRITTAGQNILHFEDAPGKEGILLGSPTGKSWIRLGGVNAPPWASASPPSLLGTEPDPDTDTDNDNDTDPPPEEDYDDGHVHFGVEGSTIYWADSLSGKVNENYSMTVGGNSTEIVLGGEELIVGGFYNWTMVGVETYWNLGMVWEIVAAFNYEFNPCKIESDLTKVKSVTARIEAANHTLEAAQIKLGDYDLELDAAVEDIKVAESTATLALNTTKAVNTKITAAESEVRAVAAKMRAVDNETRAGVETVAVGVQAIEATERSISILESHTQATAQAISALDDKVRAGEMYTALNGATVLS